MFNEQALENLLRPPPVIQAASFEEIALLFFASQEGQALLARLKEDEAKGFVYPPAAQRLRALRETVLRMVRVVLLGQDPYHGMGQANGLAFSLNHGMPLQSSLENLFAELGTDLGIVPTTSDLSAWARRGVLLLNTALTVQDGKPGSHAGKWDLLVRSVLTAVLAREAPVVFLLFGRHAECTFASVCPRWKPGDYDHLPFRNTAAVVTAHPSFFSKAKFLGTKPFSRCNDLLRGMGAEPIDWSL